MSRRIGLDAVCLKPTPRIAHTEYSVAHYNTAIVEAVLGRAPTGPEDVRDFYDAWDFDFCWSTNDGPDPWARRGRTTSMGHADYAEGGKDRDERLACPFEDPRQVLEFDAVREYGQTDFSELVAFYRRCYEHDREFYPNQLVTGGYYQSVVSGAIAAFGWEMLLTAAADREAFAKVLRSFGEITMHHVRAWAETPVEVFIQHDDFVWTEGPFLEKEFYRNVIIPLYRGFWEVLHKAGKKVLFCSDGRWDMLMPDVAAAGADGFIFEPCNPFDRVAARFGKTHCLVGSAVDCRTMTFYGWDAVRREVDATLAAGASCPGLIWAVGNHIPANVPASVGVRYFEYLKAHWTR